MRNGSSMIVMIMAISITMAVRINIAERV